MADEKHWERKDEARPNIAKSAVMLLLLCCYFTPTVNIYGHVTWPSNNQYQEDALLQIRGCVEDNSKIIFSFLNENTCCDHSCCDRLGETVLMMGHKNCFQEEMWLIIPKLSLLPFLIWTTASVSNRYQKCIQRLGKGCQISFS